MTLNRRAFLQGTAAGLGALALAPGTARAAGLGLEQIKAELAKHKGRSLTVASWGGSFQEAQRKAFFAPFAEEFGIEIVEDTDPKDPKIIAMVEAGNVSWDLVDIGAYRSTPLGKAGALEEIDYGIVDKTHVFKGFAPKWGIGNLSYSEVLAYRTDVFTEKKPSSMADLWNTADFPGMRAIRDNPIATLAYALQADGVPLAEIYPLTEEKLSRAFAKLDEIKEHVIWWSAGAQAPQLLANKEAVMVTAWNGRLDVIRDEGVPLEIVWNGAQLMGDAWAIPKGAPNADLAQLFIAWASHEDINWRLSDHITYGPVNHNAIQKVNPERAALLPTTFADVQLPCDYDYWGEAYLPMLDRWKEWKLG